MTRVTVTNCWSYYNKGDAAICVSTIKLVQNAIPEAEVMLLAFDYKSFLQNKYGLGYSVQVLPMPSMADVLRPLRMLLNLVLPKGLVGFFGSIFLVLSLASVRLLRRFDDALDRELHSIEEADIIIAVGGNYMYSHVGFYIHAFPIIYAKLKGKKVLLLGHSIGPFNGLLSRFVARIVLSRVDLIVFREKISYTYLKNHLKISPLKALVLNDMSFALETPTIINNTNNSQKIGITARKWLFSTPALFRRYLDSLEYVISELSKRGFSVYLVPFSYIPGSEDDLEICNLLYQNVPKKSRHRVQVLNVKEESPISLVEILEKLGLRLFIGTRMHSVILASLNGVPAVTVSYQHFKGHGIPEQLGLSDYIINIEELQPEILISHVDKLLKNYEEVRRNVLVQVNRIRSQGTPKVRSLLLQHVKS